jgi:hypothetical protein
VEGRTRSHGRRRFESGRVHYVRTLDRSPDRVYLEAMTTTTTRRSTMKRTDEHAPSTFDPAKYTEVGHFDNHYEDGYCYIEDGFHDTTGIEGNYDKRGRCDHCGAGPLRYGVIFHHESSNVLVVVGIVCASKLAMTSRTAYDFAKTAKVNKEARIRRERAEEFMARATGTEREALAFADDVCKTEYVNEAGDNIFRPKFPAVDGSTVAFISDLMHKLHRYGSLSEKQIGALVKIKARNDDFLARNAAQAEALADAPPLAEGRQTVEGEVVMVKFYDNDFGGTFKMLVKMDDGNKVFGSVPSNLMEIKVEENVYENLGKGDRVKFDAAVTPKADDVHFGFYKRPTKAERIEKMEGGE